MDRKLAHKAFSKIRLGLTGAVFLLLTGFQAHAYFPRPVTADLYKNAECIAVIAIPVIEYSDVYHGIERNADKSKIPVFGFGGSSYTFAKTVIAEKSKILSESGRVSARLISAGDVSQVRAENCDPAKTYFVTLMLSLRFGSNLQPVQSRNFVMLTGFGSWLNQPQNAFLSRNSPRMIVVGDDEAAYFRELGKVLSDELDEFLIYPLLGKEFKSKEDLYNEKDPVWVN